MAVKWAVANGNWSDGTTWNDGVVPTIGDDVYLNGHDVTVNTSPIINYLSNYATGSLVAGGAIYYTGSRTLTTNKIEMDMGGGDAFIFQQNSPTINCFINCPEIRISNACCFVHTYGVNRGWEINGNLYIDNCSLCRAGGSGSRHLLTINGNLVGINNNYFVGAFPSNANGGWTITINGNATKINDDNANNLGKTIIYIAGTFRNNDNQELIFYQSTSTLTVGSIEYWSNNNTYGVKYIGLVTPINPDTFYWRDITEPQRINPIIILANGEMNNRQQYPPENEVKEGTEYVWGEKVGTYKQPPESVVLKGYVYDNGDKIGSLENQNIVGCVTKEDVREGVELIGLQEVGTLVVPSVDDVREGVVFDNGSVGTLIVQGGGDRLRIADFGYYTRSTSITYIVDLTESDKPAFADCEEIVLRSLFPTLDFDNIPDKFFDDLFIQFLRYRLLVEYYRGISVNSKFTPSEPTAEIVNYANTKCEYWLNTANLFLQLWGEKYPNSVKKDRILL